MKSYVVYVDGEEVGMIKARSHNAAGIIGDDAMADECIADLPAKELV
jgi:hypothetical protein